MNDTKKTQRKGDLTPGLPGWGWYRKKPVVVQAQRCYEETKIPTLEGVMTASPGDWIITGVKGERYPCKPDIFEATYERVPFAPENAQEAPDAE